MIFILHGENLSRSRNAVLGLQEKLGMSSKQDLSITDITPGDLLDACTSFDLFGQAPFVVLDITDVGRMNISKFVDNLDRISPKAALIILSGKKLSKANPFIKNATKLKAKIILSDVKQESNVFSFADSVFTGNRIQGYKELRKLLLDKEDPFKIFSMLLYSLRILALSKFDSTGFAKLSPFVKSKAKKQARSFSKEQLLGLFAEFYKMDRDVKIGELPVDLLVPLAMEKVFAYVSKSV